MAHSAPMGATAPGARSRASSSSPTVVHLPTGRARTIRVNRIRRADDAERAEWALQHGFVLLNAQERMLIAKLRNTTYPGRDLALRVVNNLSALYPWTSGSSDNTRRKP